MATEVVTATRVAAGEPLDFNHLEPACPVQLGHAMRTPRLCHALLFLLFVGCASDPGFGGAGDGPSCGKCDDPSAGAGLSNDVPGEAAVMRIYQDALRGDGSIDGDEAAAMAAFVKKYGGKNQRVVAFLRGLLAGDGAVDGDARAVLQAAVADERPDDVPLANAVYEVVPGTQEFLFDDALYLRGDGTVAGDTGIASHSRGYAAKRDGVLFTRHGSLAPRYASTSTAAETEALRAQGPDAALDRAAEIYGLDLDQWNTFGAIARDSNYYDPSSATPYWAGICQGWTHNALDNRISELVDVAGPEGDRGLWIFGQWISRADLGNAMMGASFSLGIADSVTIDSFVTPESLVKGLAEYVLRSGTGLRVDIWNDSHNASGSYDPQIWNQPVVAGQIETAQVTPQVAEAIIAHAVADPRAPSIPADAGVRRVRATALWGAEANDAWEGRPLYRSSEWNMYMVTAADGRVLKGYMAFELAAAGIDSLPVADSDGLPDYIAYPRHELTDAALDNGEHRLLDSSHPEGVRFRFLVGTVLARGIPDSTRAAFEAEALRDGADPADLAARYPGIANAYSPAQWQQVFEPRLGPGADFGAVWTN